MGRPIKTIVLSHETFIKSSKDYRHYLEALGYSLHTVQTKHSQLNRFLHWAEILHLQALPAISAGHLEAYQAHLREQPNRNHGGSVSPKTIYDKLRSVELFFIMLQAKGQITINPFGTFRNIYRETTTERTILTQQEVRTLYHAAENCQERTLLSLAYGCGLRAGELEAVNVRDIRLRDGILIVPKGKGNKRRTVPLSSGVREDLKSYYHHHRPHLVRDPAEEAFMLHSKGGRMRAYTWNKYLKRIIARTQDWVLQSKNISLHSLRHSIASHLLEQGVPVEQVRLFLGHSQLETTEAYTRVNQEQLQKLIQ